MGNGGYGNVALCSISMANCAALQLQNDVAVSECMGRSLACSSTQFYRSAKKSGGFGLPSPSFSGIGSMFGRLFRSSEPQATRASLGGQCSMYHDTEKKRWRERGQETVESEACSVGSVPPPPMVCATVKCEAEGHDSNKKGKNEKKEKEQKSSLVPSAPSRMKTLEGLLCLAAANGSFRRTAQSVLGVKDESICAWAAEFGTSTEILLTALVLAYLRSEFPKEKDTWTLVACKSKAWLVKQESEWKTEAIKDVEF